MKRVIKFRGYTVFTQKENKFVYGYLIKMFDELSIMDLNSENDVYPIDRETIGQFTGRLDDNGKEIYEGDIVKAYKHGDLESEPHIHEITYRAGSYWFGPWMFKEFLNIFRFVAVVANIYE